MKGFHYKISEWEIQNWNVGEKDIWEKKYQFSDYFEHRIGIKSLSGYLEQVESWTILCWSTWPLIEELQESVNSI